jgi:acyl-coenzyme A synthetase/AMP-(fatty) acid ligase
MIIVSGFNVYPTDVEQVLYRHPKVQKACVIGIPDETTGEAVKAYIVLKPGHSPGEGLKGELQKHVKDKLAPYKYPRWIEFLGELPKTATGKIQRFKLR